MQLSLDDLYRMTAHIYQDANLGRSREATLLHFVEVCGMLTLIDRKKKRDKFDVPGALCKALGWYFPLLAKMGVESVEQLLFAKYPGVCPYCRKAPHNEQDCKLVRGTDEVLSHEKVRELKSENWDSRPTDLNGWQAMFSSIYPRSLNAAAGFSTIALLEEVGELAEAVRVFDRYPHYFYGEAADVFSYIMGLANEYSLALSEREESFDFQVEYLARYPGLCIACGAKICICPTVPQATVGRMAKEMPLSVGGIQSAEEFEKSGRDVADRVLESVGRVTGIDTYLPFDRGEMNAGLTQLAFRLANALGDNKDTADQLFGLAIKLGNEKRQSGTEAHRLTVDVLDLLKEAWLKADPEIQAAIELEQPELRPLTHIFYTNILVVTANPRGKHDRAARLDREISEIQERVLMGNDRDRINISTLTAATVDRLRHRLLSNSFDVVHFAGHANAEGIELDGEDGVHILEFGALMKMLEVQKSLKCVILNACSAMQGLDRATGPLIIGMVDEIDDDEAIVFAKGFYDALASGRSPEEAVGIAETALESMGMDRHIVARISGTRSAKLAEI